MGRHKNSIVHELYSNWHFGLVKKDPDKYGKLWTCDIDRLWVEHNGDEQPVVCVLDLKLEGSNDKETVCETKVYQWFKNAGARVYIVWVNRAMTRFRLVNERKQQRLFDSEQFADWLLNQRKV